MAFPKEVVELVCDSFLQRIVRLLRTEGPPDSALSKIHYGLLTLKLIFEKNEDAVHHVSLAVAEERGIFLKEGFEFIINSMEQAVNFEIIEMIQYLISKIFSYLWKVHYTFSNVAAVQQILYSLQSHDVIAKVPSNIIHLMCTGLFLFSSNWAVQPEDICSSALTTLEKAFQYSPLDIISRVFIKCILIQLASSRAHPILHSISEIGVEEAHSLLMASSLKPHVLTNVEVVQLLKCLILYEGNKSVLLEQGVMDFFAPLVDDDSTQLCAAELLCSLLDSNSTNDPKRQSMATKCTVEGTQLFSSKTELLQRLRNVSIENEEDSSSETVAILYCCAMYCFQGFTSACGSQSEATASMNLMYTNTLIRFIMDILGQESEQIQKNVANSLATLPGGPEAFVHMLWGGSIVVPLEKSKLPSSMWISAFFDIKNLIVLLTHSSDMFCQSLCNAGFIHFMECELERLTGGGSKIEDELKEMLMAHTFSILVILYNCVQRKDCLPLFLSEPHLSDSLILAGLSSNIQLRFICKLILGYISPILTKEQQSQLVLKPDEQSFLISSLSQCLENSSEGYSLIELLHGLLSFTVIERNVLICHDPALLKIFNCILECPERKSYQSVILQILWNLVIPANEKVSEKRKDLLLYVPIIEKLPVTSETAALQCSVLYLIQNDGLRNDLDLPNLLKYTRESFQYKKYSESIASANYIIRNHQDKADLSMVNEAKLLKGKSLFYSYENMQQVYFRTRSLDSVKEVQLLKLQCYEIAKEAILLLGTALDYNFIDEEGSKILDCAMIDYVREVGSLGSCQRCLLCCKKGKIRRSHIYPKCILKDISKDFNTGMEHHKVFSSMFKLTKAKTAGQLTVGMLCGQCEQCLCQNGEEQFFEQIHTKVCINRKIVQSELKLQYGSWLYDFCIGILFRSFAVSNHFPGDSDLYKIFTDCRKHLLSLTTPPHFPIAPPKDPLPTFLLINPVISHKKIGFIPKTPASFTSPISLDKGIYSHNKRPHVFCAHFDCINILVQLQLSSSSIQHGKINPSGGELFIPAEHVRWKVLPTGVWKLFSSFAQAKKNVNQTGDEAVKERILYYPKNIIHLKYSPIFFLLPDKYSYKSSDTNKISVQLPKGHRYLMFVREQWNHEQEMTYCVAESPNFVLYLIFILSVPGWQIIDGLLLDSCTFQLTLPFLDGRPKDDHPIKMSVLQAWMELVLEIEKYLAVRIQLS